MWFANIAGKQTPLGITDPADEPGAALARERLIAEFASAVAARIPSQPSAPADARTAAKAVAGFLESRRGLAPPTLAGYRLALNHFCADFGARPLLTLGAAEVERWADRPGWSSSTRNTYLGAVMTMLKWACHPLPIRRPPKESRGAETILTDEQFERVLVAAACRIAVRGDLRELLRVLRETGARPQEVAPLTCEAVDWENACVRLKKHKTRRHTGADRVIHFNAAAMALLRAQRAEHGSGVLFRTRAGNAFGNAQIVRRLGVVSKRVGFRVIAYGLGRHSFATRALAAGVPDAVVAELLGHRGTGMLTRHYSHLGQRAAVLKAAAEKVSKAG